jgi:acyl dehydratase
MRLGELPQHIGMVRESPWILVDQTRIDAFADCTEDHTFIHVDPVAAARVTGTGGTIAHGFLSLSLLGGMATRALKFWEQESGVNYGFEKIRFLSPVPSGSRVRAVYRLADATMRKPRQWRIRFEATLEIEGAERPAVVADWIIQAVDFAENSPGAVQARP